MRIVRFNRRTSWNGADDIIIVIIIIQPNTQWMRNKEMK